MYSITEGFSPILYCRPDVVTLGNPFDTMKRFCLYCQCLFPPKPLDTLPLEVDAHKVWMRSDLSLKLYMVLKRFPNGVT